MRSFVLLVAGMLLAGLPSGNAAGEIEGVTSVSSKASSDYVRARLADGKFQPEHYAFGDGGHWGGALDDKTIDRLKFIDVARVISGPLAGQNYLPTKDPREARLLIMVYWGTTVATERDYKPAMERVEILMQQYRTMLEEGDPGAEGVLEGALSQISVANHQRDQQEFKNASMLGYDTTGLIGTDYGKNIGMTALGVTQRDLTAEIDDYRYFVVLMAYDFQMLWRQKKHKLLWETRFSIDEHHNAFDRSLPEMAQYASPYFGQDSHGLLRTRVPEGRVDIGDVRSLGEVETPKK
jgi:hypothetical protein